MSDMEARARELASMLDAEYLAPLVVEFTKDVAREAREAALREAADYLGALGNTKRDDQMKASRIWGAHSITQQMEGRAALAIEEARCGVLALIPAKGAEHE